MDEWFSALSGFEKTAYVIAILGTVFFVIKLILLLAGIDGNEVEALEGADSAESVGDSEVSDAASTLQLFTIHGMSLMFAIGGLVAASVYGMTGSAFIAAPAGFICGAVALFIHAVIMRSMLRLQEDGTARKRSGIGKLAKVYLKIPKLCEGEGKINVKINGQFHEVNAVSLGEEEIPTGAQVRVVDLTDKGVYVVERDVSENI